MRPVALSALPGAGLLPAPGQVLAAAGNVAHRVRHGRVADLRRMPRTMIDTGARRQVHHYLPAADVPDNGDPVLLVSPLAAPSTCYDLRRGCSLVEHLVDGGRPTYLVEYGDVSLDDRDLDIAPWVDEVVPAAIRAVSGHAGNRPVHVVGWSLGGTFSLLAAADRRSGTLPVASLTVLGAPVDVSRVPLIAPSRPLLDLAGATGPITRGYRMLGATPQPLVTWASRLPVVQRLVTRPIALATHLDDRDYLAQVEAVDRFVARTTTYRGRAFGQLYHRFAPGNQLAGGTVEVGQRTIDLGDVDAPVLVVAGATDGIAPVPAVHAVTPLLTASPDVRFEVVPGGHLGLLTGRAARQSTWPVLDDWFDQWSDRPPIGTRRSRSHSSAASRALAD